MTQHPDQTNRDFGSPLGMQLLAFVMRAFPRPVVYWVALIPVLWYYIVRPEGRRSSALYQKQLGLSYGPIRQFAFGLGQAKAFSEVILDNMYLGMFGPTRFKLSLKGTDIFLDALSHGKGLILLSAHVGNWHLALNFLGNTKTTVHLVTDDVRQTEVRRQMDMAKEKAGHLVLHDLNQGIDLIFELRAALARGEVVILAGDRKMGNRRTRARFLQGDAWFSTTAHHLAKLTGAPICSAFSLRTGMQRYDCYGVGPFRIKSATSDDGETPGAGQPMEIDEAVAQFAETLGQYLKKFPKQWFNFFDFWAA